MSMAVLVVWLCSHAAAAPRVEFVKQIRPVLEERCQPCHFAGGRVYDRLPFDKPQTVVKLGKKLFTRIRDEKTRTLITQFLTQEEKP
jgi:hypothetical protein